MMRIENYVGGEWRAGSGEPMVRENPSDIDEIIGEFRSADAVLAKDAIAAARDALPRWSRTSPQVRFDALDRIGTELLSRSAELGQLLAREEGKVLPEAVGEVTRAGMIFKFFAGESLRIGGERLDSTRPGIDVEITREPVGVVGAIAPWNFPFAIPAWKIAPALAYGNTVVFKPAEIVSACATALAEIISRAALPQGTFNMLVGHGSVLGKALVEDRGVDAITFTGSVRTGSEVLRQAAVRGAKVQLEMGGKNPLVVLADADLDNAVKCAINGAYFSTGQRCTASSRIIVEQAVYGKFVERMIAQLREIRIGNALHPGIDIGPASSRPQFEQDKHYLELGVREGGEVLFGGDVPQGLERGYFLRPALVAADPAHRISREEIFGPVASVMPAPNYEHALALANDTPFGLCAGICTTSLKHSTHFKRNAQAGMVMVNLPTAGVDPHVPFGGRKGSSYGSREQGRYAIDFYTTVKTAYTFA